MTVSLRSSASSSGRAVIAVLVLALPLASCAKSGSSFDEDFANEGQPPEEGNGLGGNGSPGSGPGDVSEVLCGNGVIDGGEECDGTLLGGATCQSLGFSGGGALNCDPVTCTYDESMCRRPAGQGGPSGGNGG